MLATPSFDALVQAVRTSAGLAAKRDIAAVADRLGLSGGSAVPVGGD